MAPMPQEAIDRYGDRVSPELLDFWLENGLGTFANGFLKVINPLAVAESLEALFEDSPVANDVPILATAFGDLVTYADLSPEYNEEVYGAGTYYGINFQRRVISEVGVRLPYLIYDLTGGFFQKEMLSPERYSAALKTRKKLELHQCFLWDESSRTFEVKELSEFITGSERGAFGAG